MVWYSGSDILQESADVFSQFMFIAFIDTDTNIKSYNRAKEFRAETLPYRGRSVVSAVADSASLRAMVPEVI